MTDHRLPLGRATTERIALCYDSQIESYRVVTVLWDRMGCDREEKNMKEPAWWSKLSPSAYARELYYQYIAPTPAGQKLNGHEAYEVIQILASAIERSHRSLQTQGAPPPKRRKSRHEP